ncbi:hypothetical protein MKW94_007469 [Papaver nudicaule]|uniref:Ubiquitin-like domain-containing protein n=1 Tax=Papaver nudicaule TaxID=74823 RepID=A0AA41W1L3_PAPNU|nr:hypothetical protein [Papaver nudicaule]
MDRVTNDLHEEEEEEEGRYPAAAQAGFVNVVLKYSLDGTELFFKIKPDLKLSRVMAAFCERKELDCRYLLFLYDGKKINSNHTPDKLQMKEGDIIDVMQRSNGGGCGITNNIKNSTGGGEAKKKREGVVSKSS